MDAVTIFSTVHSAAYSLTASKLDDAVNRVLRLALIYPRIPVGCAAIRLRTRFTVFADRVARSRPFVNTRPSATESHSRAFRIVEMCSKTLPPVDENHQPRKALCQKHSISNCRTPFRLATVSEFDGPCCSDFFVQEYGPRNTCFLKPSERRRIWPSCPTLGTSTQPILKRISKRSMVRVLVEHRVSRQRRNRITGC
jgi:hypothetical protein